MAPESGVSRAASATAKAHPNLALVKYWGRRDRALNLPVNGSISLNLSGAVTTTTVTFDPTLLADTVSVKGEVAGGIVYERVTAHIDRVRDLAGLTSRASVESCNDFPMAAGIASSASAFASLSLAAVTAAGLKLGLRELSVLARKGSGSAARSIPDGFAEWFAGDDDASSYAVSIAPHDSWDLRVVTVAWPLGPKSVSSFSGHDAAPTSPFYAARVASVDSVLSSVREAIMQRDLATLGMAAEREALSLHAVAMTSRLADRPWMSGVVYLAPESLSLIRAVQEWREEGLSVFFTLDAGPTVHLLCAAEDLSTVQRLVRDRVGADGPLVLLSRPGRGAWLTNP
ncbi:MAG: diphosphomevalonate decarboxylase [Anaerolineae bacterium]|jgi:diphosphomevalonate decarboxylase|nr:diphosphomevalonate decarboxylase [Anaerolineae bacterium]